jgi:hypothetical protein
MRDDKGARTYVETLRDQTEQYARNLLRENEKLRALALAVESENTRLQEEVASAREIVSETRLLRETLDEALRENRQLHTRLDHVTAELTGLRADRVHIAEQLAGIERESRGMAAQYATAMRQNASLANLYVSSHMLHATLDHDEVLSGIAQIVVNIVGSEDYAIFERDGSELRVAARAGAASALPKTRVGVGILGQLAEQASVRVFSPDETEAGLVAFIPLVIGRYVTGAIAIFRLLPQKPALDESDLEIFEMLAAHAATALYCASLHARHEGEVPRCQAALS